MAPFLVATETPLSSRPDSLTGVEEMLAGDYDPLTTAIPIAICGMALRLPGGISTPSQFWEFLVEKRDARGPIPESRYSGLNYYSKSGKRGFVRADHGYFLDESVDLGALDTTIFSMPKNEVERIDPQQRLLLELTRECLESAGEVNYRGKAIGTYVGSFGEDWLATVGKDSQVQSLYKVTGYGDFVLSNRISYEYDLKGPSMTIRTGCSSALIGLHQACLAIRSGECDSALVGGCNLLMAPGLTVDMSEQEVLSPNGSSKTFDADADGYARGEAVNVIFVKKLSDAIRDGNPIRAIIRSTFSNADGKTAGFSLPNFESHETMIRKAYKAAGIADVSATAYVECHGTGTPTGDPIETKAIANVFGDRGVYIGSTKPNVGHSEGASGLTSLIKAVMALEHSVIPPNIKFNKPNPKIPFTERKLVVPVETTPWPADRLERVSVNSFGIGGANVHAVVDSYRSFMRFNTATENNARDSAIDEPRLVVFSANTIDSLRRQVVNNQKYAEDNSALLPEIAYTLGARRDHLPHRAFSVFGTGVERNTSPFSKITNVNPQLVFMFTGQGAQWPRMGSELLGSRIYPAFARSIQRMDKALGTLTDAPAWSIKHELLKPEETSNLGNASISQPLCTAVQIALVDLLAEYGVRPYAVVGHSSGEMAAAYAAGKLTANEAIIAAYYRGVVSSEAQRAGAMAAIGMSWDDVKPYLVDGVVVACENSPSNVTISGDRDQLMKTVDAIREVNPSILARELKVDKAYHSHHMAEVGEMYESLASPYITSDCARAQSDSPVMFSSVTGKRLSESDRTDSRYWRSNLESPVLFRNAVVTLIEHHNSSNKEPLAFLEVGPHSALAGPLRQTLTQMSINASYSTCLARSKNSIETFLTAIGHLWQQNTSIDFGKLLNGDATLKVVPDLPTYPWQHDHSFLLDTRIFKAWRSPQARRHEILGIRVAESTENEPIWRNVLNLDNVPWLRDHKVKGDIIFPCAGYVGIVGEAARQLADDQFCGFSVRGMVIDAAMLLHETKTTEIITSLSRHRLTDSLESTRWNFVISSHNGWSWTKHCTGQVCAIVKPIVEDFQAGSSKLPRRIKASKWYQVMRNVGGNYGPCFQGLADVSCSTTENQAEAIATHTVRDNEEFYAVHPTKIDFFLQLFSVAAVRGVGYRMRKMVVPTFIEQMDVCVSTSELQMTVNAAISPRGAIVGGGSGRSLNGDVALNVKGVRLSPLEGDVSEENPDAHAGARTCWERDIDFADLSSMVTPNADQLVYMEDSRELTAICIHDSLRLLDGIEPAAPHLKMFLNWMKKQPAPTTQKTVDSLLSVLTKTDMQCVVVAMKQVLDNIIPIFKGLAEPIEVLMQDGILTNFYKVVNWSERRVMFRSLAHSTPNMRILEIGAGTGGTTHVFLTNIAHDGSDHLMYSSYTYTDISAGFFGAAQERFKNYPNMEFRSLDITKDPTEQGFEAHSYDLVIASNVLHATPSLVETLRNVHKLLKPEGRLYLEELSSEIKSANFVMGILPGWWLGEDDGRPDEPYVTPQRWDEDLKNAGFGGVDDIALDCTKPNHVNAFLMARPLIDWSRQNDCTVLYDAASVAHADIIRTYLESKQYKISLHNLDVCTPPADKDIISVLDIPQPFFEDIKPSKFQAFQKLMETLSSSDSGLLWLTRPSQLGCTDPRWAQIHGVARVIRGEMGIDFATCEIDDVNESVCSAIQKVATKFLRRRHGETMNPEYEYAIRNGEIYVPRIYPVNLTNELKAAAVEPGANTLLRLEIEKPGRLNTLRWVPHKEDTLADDEVLLEPKAVGMNFRDVLSVMGVIDVDVLGLENAGIVRDVGSKVDRFKAGDRVMAIGGYGFSTTVKVSHLQCVKIPESLSFTDAATMPTVFTTVLYGLLDAGRMEKGQSVLIHSACGGVGIAALQVAKMVGAEVYCTVSSEEKTQYLESTFGITRDRIFNSRDASFYPNLMKATDGRGVDIVLNSLSGELLHASWECVAEFGKMIEIGKRDLIGNGKLALNPFLLNRSYQCVDLAHLMERRPRETHRLMKTVTKYHSEGHIQPIHPVTIFPINEVQDCFLFMQKGQHIGKIVVDMQPKSDESLQVSTRAYTYRFNPSGAYLLTGGLGGLGRVVSNWMIANGARHLVYLSRSAGEVEEDETFFEELRSQGCSVTPVKGDITVLADVERAVSAASNPLKGVMNMSMVLHDQNFATMTHEAWTKVTAPKIQGTWNLHNATKNQNLDFFVLFSSVSATFGQRGQANYAGANSFLDSFVQYRQSRHLPAASINIGIMLDHGYVAENDSVRGRLLSRGNYGIKIPELLDSLTAVMIASQDIISEAPYTTPAHLAIGVRSTLSLSDPANRVLHKGDRRMSSYYNEAGSKVKVNASAKSSKLVVFIASVMNDPTVLSMPNASDFVARQIAMQLCILLLRPVEDESEIDISRSPQDLGLDSLVAIEMRSWWKETFQFDISVLEMLGTGSLLALGERAIEGLKERFEEPGEIAVDGDKKVDSLGRENPEFMAPHLPKAEGFDPPTWKEAYINDEAGVTLCQYSISSDKTSYVTMNVDLADLETKIRATDMKYRDMMIDNYKGSTESTDLKRWTTIGAENIINDDVKAAIKNAFTAQGKGKNYDAGDTTTFTPGGPGWTEVNANNVFTIGQDQMLKENAALFGNAKVGSIVASTGKNQYGALLVNMVTVLVR